MRHTNSLTPLGILTKGVWAHCLLCKCNFFDRNRQTIFWKKTAGIHAVSFFSVVKADLCIHVCINLRALIAILTSLRRVANEAPFVNKCLSVVLQTLLH